jgi:ABC-type dipeptide/oligopeptide/nickel transport system permease component
VTVRPWSHPMLSFAVRRLLRALTVLVGVSFLTFIVGHMSGDPVLLMVRGDATPKQRADLRHELGLDRPVLEQYGQYVAGALHGDLGVSYRQRISVAPLIALRLPKSLELAVTAFLVAITLAFLLGMAAALNRGRALDHLITALSIAGQVTPGFWLGLVLVLAFAVNWQLFPVSGAGAPADLVLPALTLAIPTLGRMTRLTRAGMLEVLGSDYIRTARAKGLSERQVLFVHGARNALIPLITQGGLEFGDMIGSAFIIETVFAWPGLGRMTVNAVLQRDFPVVQGCVLVTAVGFLLINLAVDLLYAVVDPRVRR